MKNVVGGKTRPGLAFSENGSAIFAFLFCLEGMSQSGKTMSVGRKRQVCSGHEIKLFSGMKFSEHSYCG